MSTFWHVWNAITPYGLVAFLILAATALIITALSARTLTDHWLGLRVGAPRGPLPRVLTIHEQREQTIRDAIHAEAERLYPGMPGLYDGPLRWPDDLCAYPPCEYEDNFTCTHHQQPQPGKHRLGSSQSRGHDVIQAVVTDLPEPWDSRWTR